MQVKGLMPPKTAKDDKRPSAEPLGEMWYGITFSPVQKFVMLGDSLSRLLYDRKIENVP